MCAHTVKPLIKVRSQLRPSSPFSSCGHCWSSITIENTVFETLPLTVHEMLEWLLLLLVLMQNHSGGYVVMLGVWSPSSPTSWDLGPRQHLFGDSSVFYAQPNQKTALMRGRPFFSDQFFWKWNCSLPIPIPCEQTPRQGPAQPPHPPSHTYFEHHFCWFCRSTLKIGAKLYCPQRTEPVWRNPAAPRWTAVQASSHAPETCGESLLQSMGLACCLSLYTLFFLGGGGGGGGEGGQRGVGKKVTLAIKFGGRDEINAGQ